MTDDRRPTPTLLKVANGIAAVVFSIVSVCMVAVITSGIKGSEVLVVSLYFAFSSAAAAFSIASLAHSDRWAPLIAVSAAAAALSAYVFEADLRQDENWLAAFLLITTPLLVAGLVVAGVARGRRQRAVPTARVHDP